MSRRCDLSSAGTKKGQLIDAIARQDLYSFLQAVFPVVSPGQPLRTNWHLEAVAYRLELVCQGKIKRLIITIPPRSLKSIMSSVAFPAFVLGRDPTRRIVCVSYAEPLALKHADDCRILLKHPLYQRLFPGTNIRRDTQNEITTSRGGMRLATSTSGTLTGRGGNIIIIDDPIKPQDAQPKTTREAVLQWFKNTLLSRLDNKSDDAIIIVMQRVHVDDLVGHVLEQGGWDVLNLPAIAEEDQYIPLSPWVNHHRRSNELLHPSRESQDDLDELKRAMGTMNFNAQYQQRPIPLKGNLVRWEWFPTYTHLPPYHPDDRIIVSWDTAHSGRELADYSVGVVLYGQGERVYVVDVVRERLEFPDLKRRVIEMHMSYRDRTPRYSLVIENVGSGMSLIQELKAERIHAVAFHPEERDKIMRLESQTPRMEAGAVYMPQKALWLPDFKAELLAFPNGRHDDQVDAFSQALIRDRKMQQNRMVVRELKGHY